MPKWRSRQLTAIKGSINDLTTIMGWIIAVKLADGDPARVEAVGPGWYRIHATARVPEPTGGSRAAPATAAPGISAAAPGA
jgi:hypothetical protein